MIQSKLGLILLENGQISKDQLKESLEFQQNQPQDERLPLGQILILKGFCLLEDIQKGLEIQKNIRNAKNKNSV